MKFIFHKTTFILGCILLFQIAVFAQTDAGIKLYQDGKYSAAADVLKKSPGNDAVAAYYLGLSYEKLGRTSEAVSSYKKSTDNAMYLISIELIKKYRGAPQIKEDIMPGENIPRDEKIRAAYDSLSRLVEIDPDKIKNAGEWENRRLVMEPFAANPADPGDNSKPKPLKIIGKPFPAYTEEARTNNMMGDVRLLVFFLANGKIGPIYPIKELSYGLTESSMNAAHSIRFAPATKNDKPITVVRIVTYYFALY